MNDKESLTGSRRRFLKAMTVAGVTAATGSRAFTGSSTAWAATSATGEAVRNRAPLAPNAFYALPLGSVRPSGWLRQQLETQASGLSGHLDETWPDVGPNSGWLGGSGESWERAPYFLDGLLPLAYLLNDARLIAKAQKYVEWTLNHPEPSGMFGPRSNDDWWPRMVMLKVLEQYGEVTGDPRVIPFLTRYFQYQLAALPSRPLRDWGKYRWQDEVLAVLWLYNRTGEPHLLELARLLHGQGYDWQAQFVDFKYTERVTPEAVGLKKGANPDAALQTHGVNNAQALKASPVWSMVSNSAEDRRAIFRQMAALDRYHGLPNGMFSADEHFAGLNPSQGIELCAVVEAMYSLEVALAIVGDPALGDRLERIAFNALPGTFTDDMWAHQYNQEPNQVECSVHSRPWTTDGPESNLYGLEPNFGCCTANYHQGWPKFTASLWMLSHDDGLAAVAYAPCSVETRVRGTTVRLEEATDYPFRGSIRITLHPDSALNFPLRLRIPEWAAGASVEINGEAADVPTPGSFFKLTRTWKGGDLVEITLPQQPRLSRWYNQSVAVERGPLIFSYPIGEDWVKLRDRGLTADWQVFPSTQWNYALNVSGEEQQRTPAITVTESPVAQAPFSLAGAPVKLGVTAKILPDWRAQDGVAAPPPQSPVTSTEKEQTITLVPYGAAKLRITAFPSLKA